MKSFRQFLTESVRTYRYKIKIAGDPGKNWLDMFSYNLNKFDPIKISDPKRTPIQETPFGFNGLKNQSVNTIDVEFRYPCTEPMVKQIARLLRYDENMVKMIQADSDESWSNEAAKYSDQSLGKEVDDSDAKKASEAYADSYLSSIEEQNRESKDDVTYSTTPSAKSYDPLKRPEQKPIKSPLSDVKRPPMPKTSANR